MKKTHLFLVLAAVVLTGAWNLLQSPVSNNEAQIVGTTRPQFAPVSQSQMSVTASPNSLNAKIPFYGTFYTGQAFASGTPVIATVFKDGAIFTDYIPKDLKIFLGYADGATTTKTGAKQLYGANFTLANKTKTGAPLPAGKYAIGISRINWTYTLNGQKILSGTPTGDTVGWRTSTVQLPVAEQPTINLSLSPATPPKSSFIANSGASNNEADKVPFLTFDVLAKGDSFTINDLGFLTGVNGGAATISTYYLYQGTTLVGTAVSSGAFKNINFPIAKDTVKTFTIKADIRNANASPTILGVDIYPTNTKITNSKGDAISYTGSVFGNQISITNKGPEFNLISKSITRSVVGATSTAIATYNIDIKAVGGDITFSGQGKNIFNFSTLLYGTPTTALAFSDVSYIIPFAGVIRNSDTSWTLQQGNTVTVNVSYLFSALTNNPNSYAGRLENINWSSLNNTSSTSLGGSTWTTNTIQLP